MSERIIRVRAFAKLNLGLYILGRRSDGYHELRTIFQVISLADELLFRYEPAASFELTVTSTPQFDDNLVTRAAIAVQRETNFQGKLTISLRKVIPTGSGLGGGSSDAAAVLLALPVLVGVRISWERLYRLAAGLGSDVPFFLTGGTALALGRGEETYPLPTRLKGSGILLVTGHPISTAKAYEWLSPTLTAEHAASTISKFQELVWRYTVNGPATQWEPLVENSFESVVLPRFPELARVKELLCGEGARWALMSGSGSTIFGVFENMEAASRAQRKLAKILEREPLLVWPLDLQQYRQQWLQWLGPYCEQQVWPPQSQLAL